MSIFPQQPFLMLPSRFILMGISIYIGLELLGSLSLEYLSALHGEEQTVITLMRLSELVGFIFIIKYFRMAENLGLQKPTSKDLRIFLSISFMCVLAVAILYGITPTWIKHINTPTWLQGLVGLILMVVLAPMIEELVFRGLLYRMLREQWGIAVSVAISAVFFSLLHHGMIISPQLAGGVIFALAYEWSRSLWVSIALHMGANSAVYLISAIN